MKDARRLILLLLAGLAALLLGSCCHLAEWVDDDETDPVVHNEGGGESY